MESQPQNPEFRINPENFHPGVFCQLARVPMKENVTKKYVFENF